VTFHHGEGIDVVVSRGDGHVVADFVTGSEAGGVTGRQERSCAGSSRSNRAAVVVKGSV
jgi:hypothetical protein